MALWRLIKKDFRLPANTLWVWPLWLLFTVPLLSTDLSVAYAADKVTRLFTLTLVAVLAPFLLCRTRRELFRFLNALALLGLIGGIQGVLTLLAGGGGHRLTAFGAQTIALARGTGMAAIWLSILMLERYALPPLLSICLVAPLAVTLLGAGSRGPILGTIGALMLLGFLFYRRDRAQLRRFVGLLLALTLAAAYGLSHAPDE